MPLSREVEKILIETVEAFLRTLNMVVPCPFDMREEVTSETRVLEIPADGIFPITIAKVLHWFEYMPRGIMVDKVLHPDFMGLITSYLQTPDGGPHAFLMLTTCSFSIFIRMHSVRRWLMADYRNKRQQVPAPTVPRDPRGRRVYDRLHSVVLGAE